MTDVNFTTHHAERIDHAHSRLDGLDQRVTKLETSEAVTAERMNYIHGSLNSINANINKVVWLIISSLLLGVIAFIVKGGLTIGQ